jgi:hypothetical protein
VWSTSPKPFVLKRVIVGCAEELGAALGEAPYVLAKTLPRLLLAVAQLPLLAGVDAKSALNAKHTASRTKLASHAQGAEDVPVNFS